MAESVFGLGWTMCTGTIQPSLGVVQASYLSSIYRSKTGKLGVESKANLKKMVERCVLPSWGCELECLNGSSKDL